MATKQQLALPVEGVTCHAWNADRSMVAICPNNNQIHIYNTTTWERLHVLGEHDMLVSGLDWSAQQNKIVSCSHDRNAFVWTFDADSNTWKPALVLLRIDRAALSVCWSTDGMKFAVTSSAKCVPVCTFESSNDWWVSKVIRKKFKSSVLCAAFHPTNGQLLACGGSDFKCRVYSTFDSAIDTGGVSCAPHFPSPLEFGEAYAEMSCMGWVNAVAWSPSGHTLVYCGHDSSIHFANFNAADGSPVVQTIRYASLPCTSLLCISERGVLAAGHDFNPLLFSFDDNGNQWAFQCFLEKRKVETAAATTGGVAAARALFQNKAARGQDTKSDGDTLWTTHTNTITCLQNCSKGAAGGAMTTFSTSSFDGSLAVWTLGKLEIDFAAMKI